MQPYSIDAKDFKPGMKVKKISEFMAPRDYIGTVLAVYPKLNALDVEWPLGADREFAEDLLLVNQGESLTLPPRVARLASIFKESLYWNEKGRKYRKTKSESGPKDMKCPKCKNLGMRKTRYKHFTDLYCCPECFFLIRPVDIYDGTVQEEITDGIS